ncbi:MAG: MBL fold metallo-hydrolase [Myxococcota bacterium]|nr:MBL fold metallo-hydrolase [Myxococcota bacterium]MEC8422944.1 MBL fold metallo-hydrolase [Myxococcota bacterium]
MSSLSLFARDLTVATLASGSSGNCTYIGDGQAGVLIDCGISTKQILLRLDQLGLKDAPIDGVLITHEHSDHVGAGRVLSARLRKRTGRHVPFYMTAGTRGGVKPQSMPGAVEVIRPAERFRVRHLEVDPFPVPHDTADPVGYRVASGGTWAGVVTDLGRPTALVTEKLRSLSIAVLEFNHDFELLMGGAYPWPLKQRIRSSHGHLSNAQAARLLEDALSPTLQHLSLAHLSGENNRPARALQAASRVLRDHGALGRVALRVADQTHPGPAMSVPVRD